MKTEQLIKRGPKETHAWLPSTKEEAWQARKNREQLAKATLESARTVHEAIKSSGQPVDVDLGFSKDKHKITARVSNAGALKGMRVKFFDNDKETASFFYPGLSNEHEKGESLKAFVLEEKIGAKDLYPEKIQWTIDRKALRWLKLDSPSGEIYQGGQEVGDNGAMDFAMVAQTMALAAEQVSQPTKEITA